MSANYRFASLFFAAVLALALAACSDDSGGGGPGLDTEQDTGGDTEQDPVADTTPDVEPDVEPDVAPDEGEDIAEEPDLVGVDLDLNFDFDFDFDLAGDDLTDGGDDVADGGDDAGDADMGGGEGVLVISEIAEGALSGGLPKWVELTNIGDGSLDLTEYSLGTFNNGNTFLNGIDFTPTAEPALTLSGTLGACESYVVNFQNDDSPGTSTFFDIYGTDPDNFGYSATINGDDVVALFLGTPVDEFATDVAIIDVFGTIGVDGTGEFWEYTDTVAERSINGAPDLDACATLLDGCASPTFAADWMFGTVGDAAGFTIDDWATFASPGTHTCP